MTDDDIARLADSVGLGEVHARYPELVRAAVARGMTVTPALDASRQATTEPAHILVVRSPAQ